MVSPLLAAAGESPPTRAPRWRPTTGRWETSSVETLTDQMVELVDRVLDERLGEQAEASAVDGLHRDLPVTQTSTLVRSIPVGKRCKMARCEQGYPSGICPGGGSSNALFHTAA